MIKLLKFRVVIRIEKKIILIWQLISYQGYGNCSLGNMWYTTELSSFVGVEGMLDFKY